MLGFTFLKYSTKFPLKSKSAIISVTAGINHNIRQWKSTFYNTNGVVKNTGLSIGFDLTFKLLNNFSFSVGTIIGQSYTFNIYNEVYNKKYKFLPLAFINIHI